jgi:uncharacterized alkaline shock family protein YloU
VTELERTAQGSVSISPVALQKLVVQVAEQVEGAHVRHPRRTLRIQVEAGKARVSLELAARRGAVLPELAADVQSRVTAALRGMLEVEVDAVDVSVEELT